MYDLASHWNEILLYIKDEYDIEDLPFDTFLRPLSLYMATESEVTIAAPISLSAIGLNYLNKTYKIPFQVTICSLEGLEKADIRFILSDEVPKKTNISMDPVLLKRSRESNLEQRYTFDTFVVGSNNKLAHAAALAVADSPGEYYNPLFIYGNAGLGKTHLIHSIAHYILEHNDDSKVLYVTSENFMNELISTIRSGSSTEMAAFRSKYRNIDVLMVDDIQFIIGKESTQEEFFHTFNSLHSAGKQIVITSDRKPQDMTILEERIRSRFEWGLTVDITAPDYETRMAILHKKEEMENFTINDEVLDYIADHIKSNIRELEGAFNKMVAYSKLEKEGQEVTLEDAKKQLKDFIAPDEKKIITTDDVIQAVVEYYEISITDIKGSKKDNKYVLPRQVAMYLCRNMISNISQISIANALGRKDHTTVINAINKIDTEIKTNENLRNSIDLLKKKINPHG